MYVNDLCNVSSHLKSILFADDTSFVVEGSDLLEMCTKVSSEMNKLHKWFKVNKLSLNLSKTNFMVFSHTNAPCEYNISIDNTNIEQINCIKFLGVYIDCKLTWSQHVNVVHTKIAKNLSVMRRVKWLLNETALYTLYCSFVLPYMDYCCEIWGNTYKNRIQPLYILQKRAIRICCQLEYRAHSKPAFFKCNALTIFDLIDLKSMVIMYKIYNRLMPNNFLSRFKVVNTTHAHNTRQENNFESKYCRTTLKAMCISIKGVNMWNCLNTNIKNCTNVIAFKKRYRSLLVSKYNI